MKKVISILLVLCVAASLFAAVTVKAGFDFGTVYSKIADDSDTKEYTHGVGFDIAVIGDVAPNLAVYGDISATWPIFAEFDDVKITKDADADWDEPTSDWKVPGLKISTLALRAGAMYKLNVQGFDLGLGGGFVMSFFNTKAGNKDLTSYMSFKVRNYGLSLYATGTYAVAKNVGVNLTINPDVYLYNYTSSSAKFDEEEVTLNEKYGFKLGFGFNASVGVAFTF